MSMHETRDTRHETRTISRLEHPVPAWVPLADTSVSSMPCATRLDSSMTLHSHSCWRIAAARCCPPFRPENDFVGKTHTHITHPPRETNSILTTGALTYRPHNRMYRRHSRPGDHMTSSEPQPTMYYLASLAVLISTSTPAQAKTSKVPPQGRWCIPVPPCSLMCLSYMAIEDSRQVLPWREGVETLTPESIPSVVGHHAVLSQAGSNLNTRHVPMRPGEVSHSSRS